MRDFWPTWATRWHGYAPMEASSLMFKQFHEQVESALAKLLLKHGPKGVKAPMIYKAVNPLCSPQQYSQAFRRIGVRFTKSGIVFVRTQIELRRAEIIKEKNS
jgi:hypothetical protein